jgi:hypothetical protein
LVGLPLVEAPAPASDVTLLVLPGLAGGVQGRRDGGDDLGIAGLVGCSEGGIVVALEGSTTVLGGKQIGFVFLEFGAGKVFERFHGGNWYGP